MMKLLSLASAAALVLVGAPLLFGQTPSPTQDTPQPETKILGQQEAVFSPVEKLEYFVLEHRSPEQMEGADADLVRKRQREIFSEAEFYGYEISAKDWKYEQSVCPLMPDSIMLLYTHTEADGAESKFTALVPRSGGRIRLVPVLNRGTTRFKPAPEDPRNFQLFAQLVPADLAKQNSGPEGKWLLLSLCYAEMTGARPQVPGYPGMDIRMIKAPPPTLHVSVTGQEHEVRFVDPVSSSEYRLWDIDYDGQGHITSVSDDKQSFGAPVVKVVPEPAPKAMPLPPVKQTTSTPVAPAAPKTTPIPPQ